MNVNLKPCSLAFVLEFRRRPKVLDNGKLATVIKAPRHHFLIVVRENVILRGTGVLFSSIEEKDRAAWCEHPGDLGEKSYDATCGNVTHPEAKDDRIEYLGGVPLE